MQKDTVSSVPLLKATNNYNLLWTSGWGLHTPHTGWKSLLTEVSRSMRGVSSSQCGDEDCRMDKGLLEGITVQDCGEWSAEKDVGHLQRVAGSSH